jgi:hypothetical protein
MADDHIPPGFLTVGAAANIKRSIAETDRLRQKAADAMVYADVKDFPASITSGSGGYHAWTEQAFGTDGERYTKPGGRTGTADSNPAVLPDRSTLSSFPVECWLRRTQWSADKGVVYETVGISATSSSGGATYVDYDVQTTALTTSYTTAAQITLPSDGLYQIGCICNADMQITGAGIGGFVNTHNIIGRLALTGSSGTCLIKGGSQSHSIGSLVHYTGLVCAGSSMPTALVEITASGSTDVIYEALYVLATGGTVASPTKTCELWASKIG